MELVWNTVLLRYPPTYKESSILSEFCINDDYDLIPILLFNYGLLPNQNSLESKLEELKRLKDKKLVSNKEYKELRKKLLNII